MVTPPTEPTLQQIADAINKAVVDEREACAIAAENFKTDDPGNQNEYDWPFQIAAIIRARR